MFAHMKVPLRGQIFHIQLLHKSASTHCMSLFYSTFLGLYSGELFSTPDVPWTKGRLKFLQENKLISFTQILTSDLTLNKQNQTLHIGR